MSNLLEIKDLYGGYEQDVNILQGIDLTVAEGEAVGIIGLNGSGKSTLGKAVMNLIPYRKGSIVFNGQPIEDKSTHELARMGIAMMHQGGVVFPNLSVWQNLQMAVETQDFASLQSIIPLLQKPKKELMHTMADKLSGGQRHELALAMTLARQPKLVILDEPSAGLSPKAVEEMYEMLGKIRENYGITIILIEQNVTRAVGFCDRLVILQEGVVKFESSEKDTQRVEHLLFNKEDKSKHCLYTKDFWNNIYLNHYNDAPWMNDSWKGEVLNVIEKYIPDCAGSLLDYGCGNGYMGRYFYDKGLKVDLSDISDKLVEILKTTFSETSIGIFQTNTPDDLIGKKYDVIIAWSLFHHINPLEWRNFLDGFRRLLNKGGVLVIGGWDENDAIIKEDGNKARYTGHETWCINKLANCFDRCVFLLLKEDRMVFTVPPFTIKRIQHVFVLKKR